MYSHKNWQKVEQKASILVILNNLNHKHLFYSTGTERCLRGRITMALGTAKIDLVMDFFMEFQAKNP